MCLLTFTFTLCVVGVCGTTHTVGHQNAFNKNTNIISLNWYLLWLKSVWGSFRFQIGATGVNLTFTLGMARDNGWYSSPIPSKVMAWLGALHSHNNIFWSAVHVQPAHELINPTCLTTSCQVLHQHRSAAAAKGQCFSNSRGTEAWTQCAGNNF